MKKLAALVTLLVVCTTVPGAQGKRFITEQDLFKFTWIADPQISPDGATVAFVRVTVNEKENRYESSLFAVASAGGDAPRRLTSGFATPRPAGRPTANGSPSCGRSRRTARCSRPDLSAGDGRRRGAADHRRRRRCGQPGVVARREVDRLHQRPPKPEDPKPAPDHKSDVEVDDARRVPREWQSRLRRQRPPLAHFHNVPVPAVRHPSDPIAKTDHRRRVRRERSAMVARR